MTLEQRTMAVVLDSLDRTKNSEQFFKDSYTLEQQKNAELRGENELLKARLASSGEAAKELAAMNYKLTTAWQVAEAKVEALNRFILRKTPGVPPRKLLEKIENKIRRERAQMQNVI